jgi:hypothetical protein
VGANVALDTRLDWTTIAQLARPAAPADAPAPVTCDLLCRVSDPRDRLWICLDAWAGMDEAAWPEANVKALYEDIMDIFREHSEAEAWFREWRATRPEARLC